MKRTVLFSTLASTAALLVALAPGLAQADEVTQIPDPDPAMDYDPTPGVLVIPDAEVMLVPASMCPIPQGGADNSGLLCSSGVSMPTAFPPIAGLTDIIGGVQAALAPYNILVTSTMPPPYVPFQMLIPTDNVDDMSMGVTCTAAGTDCDGKKRNDIAFTLGGTMACMDPDQTHAALYAFGRMSGLEGKNNPADPMNYPPDYTMPASMYQDMCDAMVQTIDPKTMMPDPFVCVGLIHEVHCMDMADQQNSHLELEAVYSAGPWVEDTTPPTLDSITIPADGEMIPEGMGLNLNAMLTDDSGLVFAQWTISSPALAGLPGADENGRTCKATNDVCAITYDGIPYYDSSQGFPVSELSGALPGGEYTITFEASDLSGNTIEPMMVTVTIAGGAADESGTGGASMTTTAGTTGMSTTAVTSFTSGESGGSEEGQSGDEGGEDKGCACTATPRGGVGFMLAGLFGLAVARRRRD
jgi:MYXO-CTERM domain-containing protein